MTDTETRLRDYLHTQAAAVPDTAQGPGFEPPVRRRHWPVLAAAATIAVVLVITVTFLTRTSDDGSIPVPAGPPPGPVSHAAPEVPYTVMTGDTWTDLHATLHDGDQTVQLPAGVGGFGGRVDGGWFGTKLVRGKGAQAGILKPDGTFRTIGPEGIELAVLSPDHRQVAVILHLDEKGAIAIFDVKSGKEVTRTPVLPVPPADLAWNQSGIWVRVDQSAQNQPTTYELYNWRPKSGKVTRVPLPQYNGGLAAPGASDVVSVTRRRGNNRCLRAGVLRDGQFDTTREYCDVAAAATYPVMSQDGRTMVSSDVKLAIDIESGKQTKLQLPADTEVTSFPAPVFENVSQVLLVTRPAGNNRLPVKEKVYRCDVRSGECAVALSTSGGVTLYQQ
ncbi:MAG TPA: hypothetical protein VG497_01640 [Kribbella sp.]|nr:hypothetical protein [Kribbella sp.]